MLNNLLINTLKKQYAPKADTQESRRQLIKQRALNELKSLQRTSTMMPDSCEKILIELLCLCIVRKEAITSTELDEASLKGLNGREINVEFARFKQMSENEALGKNMTTSLMINQVQERLQSQNWSSCVNELRKLLKTIRPLDIQELFSLIAEANKAAGRISDQEEDVVLFVGGTGTGKSTTIHFLAGSKMVETTVELESGQSIKHISPEEPIDPKLMNIKCSPFAESETRYITPVEVSYKQKKILLCDAPGFGDTSGVEVDISNSLGINKAIQGCKSIRLVILLSYLSIGDRGEGLKNLVRILAGMVKDIQTNLQSFQYIFTKYPQNENIHGKLAVIRDAIERSTEMNSDAAFKALFDDLLKKTERGAQCLDPLNDDPSAILSYILSAPVLHDPKSVFQCSINDSSYTIIREQCTLHKLSIISAIKRCDYRLVEWKLGELKKLNELLQNQYIGNIYQESVQIVANLIEKKYKDTTSVFERCIESLNLLTEDDINQFKACLQDLQEADVLKTHLGAQCIQSSILKQYLESKAGDMVSKIKDLDRTEKSAVRCYVSNLRILSKHFSDILVKYQEACLSLQNQFNDCAKLNSNSLNAETIATQLSKLKSMETYFSEASIFKNDISIDTLQTGYNSIIQAFKTFLVESSKKTNFKEIAHVFESSVSCVELQNHIPKEELMRIYNEFLERVGRYCETITKQIDEKLKAKAFGEVKDSMSELNSLKTIQITANENQKAIQSIVNYIDRLRNEIEQQIRGEEIDSLKLSESLAILENSKWLEEIKPGYLSDVNKSITESMNAHVRRLCDQVRNADLLDYSEIKRVNASVKKLESLGSFEKYAGNDMIAQTVTSFKSTLQNSLQAIKSDLAASDVLSFDKVEKALCFTSECQKIEGLDEESVEREIVSYIDVYVKTTRNDVQDYFQKIQSIKQIDEGFEYAQKLHSRLEQIREYEACKEKYSKLSAIVGTRLTSISVENARLRALLKDEIKSDISVHNTKELQIKGDVARVMTLVDDSFAEIYKEIRQELYKEVTSKYRDAMDYIERNEFRQLSTILLEISTKNEEDLLKIKHSLGNSLTDLVEKTKKLVILLGRGLEIGKINDIIENIELLSKAEKYVFGLRDGNNNGFVESDTRDVVRTGVKAIQDSLDKKLAVYLDHIEVLVNTRDFYEAEEKIEHAREILEISSNTNEEVKQKFTELSTSLETTLNETVTKYTQLEISDYVSQQPIYILERLKKVANYKKKYNEALSAVKNAIKQKMENACLEAKENRDKRRELLREIEFAIKSLPDDLKYEFERQLEGVRDDIEKDTRVDEAICNEKLQTNDPHIIAAYMNECIRDNKAQILKKIHEGVLEKVNNIKGSLTQALRNDDPTAIREHIGRIQMYVKYFSGQIKEINGDYETVQRLIIDKFASICDFLASIGNTEKSIDASITQRNIELFFLLLEIMNPTNYSEEPALRMSRELLSDVENRISKLGKELEELFVKTNKMYRLALEELQIDDVYRCLKVIKSSDSFICKIISQPKQCFNGKPLFENIQVTTPYSEILKQLVERLDALKGELLSYEEIQGSEATLNSYYEKFSKKVALLSHLKMFDDVISSKIRFDSKSFETDCTSHIKEKVEEMSAKAKMAVKNDSMRNKDYDEIHLIIQNLKSFDKYCKLAAFSLKQKLNEINSEIDSRIRAISVIADNDDAKIEEIGESLIKLKLIGDNIISFKETVNQEIDAMLLKVKNKDRTGVRISLIATYLQRDVRGIGQIILQEHNTFKGESISFFNIETKRKDIMYVLENLGDGSYLDQYCARERRDKGCQVCISKTNLDGTDKVVDAGCNKTKNRSCYCDIKTLFDAYNIFDEKYKGLLKDYLFNRIERNEDKNNIITELINGVKAETRVGIHNDDEANINWSNASIKQKIPNLLAYIFAVWTIKHAEYYLEMKNNNADKKETYLLQPHPAQVVAIFRILGIGYREVDVKSGVFKNMRDYFTNNKDVAWKSLDGLVNNLAQILTGQGKSVVLAVTSIVLALFDIDVSCACYSEYLSKRDLEAFTELFDAFGVSDRIKYGTFNRICENIINENGDIRQQIVDLVMNKTNSKSRKASKRPKVLLIDEVDIFFTKLFYGNVYTPVVRLKDALIIKLVDLIWQRRNEATLTLKSIETQDEYKNCCARFKGWEFLIREAVKNMLVDVKDYKHDYIVSNNKIAYYEHDSISYNISYGYKTLFAYYHECDERKVTRESLEENVCIEIHCGSFSYAEIPHRFLNIMGVTGTLETLNPNEAAIVKNEYKIDRFSIIPSVYSENKLVFAKNSDVFIENKDSYFITLFEKIEEKLKEKDYKRAVLVFFETPKKLNEFYNSPQFGALRGQAMKITEDLTRDEKEKNIKRSTTAGQVTLATSSFGRGTDFICRDQNVLSNGGLHVIQTFLSENYSDEVQIKGRTARQGQSGSYSMVLLDEDLEKYLGTSYKEDIQNLRNNNRVYDGLHDAARLLYEKKFNDLAKYVTKARTEHEETMRFLKSLEENNIENIRGFLGERNKGATTVDRVLSRTICLMDATGSMSSLLLKVKTTVASMFERVTHILKEHGISQDCFQMQFAVYRDYDSGVNRVLQFSSWESQPNNLRQFMETQKAEGGDDYEEAIEVAFWHVNEEHKNAPVSQVILIGDAPAKNKQSIENDRRKHYGISYWNKTKYSQVTDYETEARKLHDNGVKVHAFYLDNGAKANFESIAEITKGAAHRLNIHSDNSDDVLTGIVSKQILEDIGKAKGNSNELLESYKREYGVIKGYFE